MHILHMLHHLVQRLALFHIELIAFCLFVVPIVHHLAGDDFVLIDMLRAGTKFEATRDHEHVASKHGRRGRSHPEVYPLRNHPTRDFPHCRRQSIKSTINLEIDNESCE